MSEWIKAANRIGSYHQTYRGFRIYWQKRPQRWEEIYEKDSEKWRRVTFVPGYLVAIDKTGTRIESEHMDPLYLKIDVEHLNRYYDRKEERDARRNHHLR